MTGQDSEQQPSLATQRRRLTLLVHLAASAGQFSTKLSEAVSRATDSEVRVMSDLVDRGMTVPELVSVLQGAHVVVGDDDLYQAWIFPTSRRRMSSHHRGVDKGSTPDYGLDGPLVRESLHGKAAVGTWVQLERTKATFQWGKLPSWHDLVHIRDFIIYRITGKNVGPWGLSALVDTRPMVLRPPNTTSGQGADRGLALLSTNLDGDDSTEAPSWANRLTPPLAPVGPLGDLYTARGPVTAQELLPDRPWSPDLGEGLFGSLAVLRARITLPQAVRDLLDTPPPGVNLTSAEGQEVQTIDLSVREFRIPTRAVVQQVKNRAHGPAQHEDQEA